ncbi:acetate/propionate family kinase [Yinghuangia seranimata]|uniref:acetate/propionate family kinase n=1 Tax=Yinghuangia seranimata TaxID=408067 RepID=UPI00248C4BE9|nr:acetate/propionate family kinase [Yinghuangia seranimata]MDI2125450.1 acetate/propionate family kinase [Yinghuangia seranimata]
MNATAPGAAEARVLVVNAGSSTLKLSVLEPDGSLGAHADIGTPDGVPPSAVPGFVRGAGRVDAVGHRVVHGGNAFAGPVRVTPDVVAGIAALAPLAPLHQGRALAAIDAVRAALPDTPAVACFDTAFHRTIPDEAATYALPRAWRDKWHLRRHGFHGLSHAYAARRGAELAGLRPASARVVSCHLGAGASLCAVRGGVSVDTTMGFTPTEGLVMATRPGDVDPGLLVWLLRQGVTLDELDDALEHGGGLSALASGGGDMKALRDAAAAGDPEARQARAVYTYRLGTRIATMAAGMGGLDALVFTGGVGEHDAAVRADATARLAFLGVRLDAETNETTHADGDISAFDATVPTLVVTAREDLEIAAQTRHVLADDPPPADDEPVL